MRQFDMEIIIPTSNETATLGISRTALLVLGMHRSGTSALTGILSMLGCELPRTLMPPSSSNPKGHFESLAVRKLNDKLLASAVTTWDSFCAVPPEWFDSTASRGFDEQALDLLRGEFGDSRLFVLKDPRICRLLPFWCRVLDRFGAVPQFVLIHRNPSEVAASLQRRNGIDMEAGHLIWLRHVLDAEIGTRELPRYFTSYDRVLVDWRTTVTSLGEVLGIHLSPGPEKAAQLDTFLSASLRHFSEASKDNNDQRRGPGWIERVYATFERWSEQGEDAEGRAVLDEIRLEFNVAAKGFAFLDYEVRASHARQASLQSELEAAKQTEASASASLVKETDRRTAAERRVDIQKAEAAEMTLRVHKLERQLEDRFAELAELTRRLLDRETELMRKAILQADARSETDRKESMALRERLNSVEQVLNGVLSSTSWRMTQPLRHVVDSIRGHKAE